MRKLIRNIILGASSLLMMIGGVNTSFRSESTNKEVLISQTQKREAPHTSNYSDYTYTGDYYSSIDISSLTNGINGSLRNQLTDLIHPAGYHKYSSDDSGSLSYKLQEADEDPNNSSNMIMFYTRNSVTKTISDGGTKWNREHVWCQSLSNDHWGTEGPGADIYHIRPVYPSINSSRSDTPFGEVSGGTTKTYNNMTYGYLGGGYFEPLPANKGDIARILMYIYVAYYDDCGSDRPDLTKVIESYDTLLTWHTNDKPDKLEGNRNNYVSRYTNQKNRNPFVDHPEYAWHIFGSKCSSSVLSACKEAYPDETTSSSGGSISGGSTSGGTNTNLGADLASKKATYTITSTSAVTASGNIPTVSSASYSSTYNYKYQLTSGNSMTLTLSNYTNMVLKGITFSMKSNKSAGSASLKVLAGSTQLKNMQAYSFSDDHWYGAFSQEYVNVGINLTEKDHVTKDSENITITVTSTENSVYVQSITVGYEVASTLSSITLSGMTTEFNVGDTFVFDGQCTANYTTGETKVVTPTSISKPDMSTPGSKIVTVSYTEGTKTVSKNYTINVKATTVTPPNVTGNYYQKVETTPSTLAGTYLIVCKATNVAFNGALTSLDAAGNNIGITISNNKVASTSSIDAATFTISNNGTIKSKSGYYIGQTSDANGLASSTSSSYTNTITITNGNADIVSGGAYLRYNSASNNLRFRYYKSATYTSQKAIQLYKLVDGSSALTSAKAWANTFLSSITCNNGVTKPSVSNWNTQATSYRALSDEAKTIFIEATYIREGSTVTPTNNTNSVIANAVARYDYIVEKYGEDTYQAFITDRALVNSLNKLPPVVINDINPFFLITTISVLGVVIILIIKKKKNEKK